MKNSIPKSALHHWWPRAVQQHWIHEGGINILKPDGTTFKTTPGRFGAIKNAHILKLAGDDGSPWDQSFEDFYSECDTQIHKIIQLAQGLPYEEYCKNTAASDRAIGLNISDEAICEMAKVLFCMIVRMPSHRQKIAGTVEGIFQRGGSQHDYEADKHIINVNVFELTRTVQAQNHLNGKMTFLRDREKRFVMGDGVYNNLHVSSNPLSNFRCVYPLTPEYAVLYDQPGSCVPFPRVLTLDLSRADVEAINDATRCYSKNFLAFIPPKPTKISGFEEEEFMEYGWPDPFDRICSEVAFAEPSRVINFKPPSAAPPSPA